MTYIELRYKIIREETKNQQNICNLIEKCIDLFKQGQIRLFILNVNNIVERLNILLLLNIYIE